MRGHCNDIIVVAFAGAIADTSFDADVVADATFLDNDSGALLLLLGSVSPLLRPLGYKH